MLRRFDYTAVTSGGDAYDIRFPLHPHTGSPEAVSDLLTAVLGAVTEQVETCAPMSDGDVLQGLAMALAVRARAVSVPPATSLRLMHELVDVAFAAALDGSHYRAGRA